MTGTVGWHVAELADVPGHDDWLSPAERDVLAGLRIPPRRADWRLGRWVTKLALIAYLGPRDAAPQQVSILAAADGAPEAWLGDTRAPATVSLSHRAGRAVAAVGSAGGPLGIDLELVEPRRPEFLEDWFAVEERAGVTAVPAGDARDRAVATVWTLKEAAAKAVREGLRLDVRDLRTTVAASGLSRADDWRPAAVTTPGGPALPPRIDAWVRDLDDWVVAIAAPASLGPPRRLAVPGRAT